MLLRRWAHRKWLSRSFLLLAVAVLLCSLVFWTQIFSFLGRFLVCSQTPQRADLILVLAGNFYGPRVVKSAELVTEHYAPLVLISGKPYQDRTEGEAAIWFLTRQGYPAGLFESFVHNAPSTIEEAIVLRGELARRHVRHVILVTSSYHSRRAAIVFRLFCPDVDFISVPGLDPDYHPDTWWKDPRSRSLFVSEWTKIIGTVVMEYPKKRIEAWFGA